MYIPVKLSMGLSKQSLERSDWQTEGCYAGCCSVPGWTAGKGITVSAGWSWLAKVMLIDVYKFTKQWHHVRPASVYAVYAY